MAKAAFVPTMQQRKIVESAVSVGMTTDQVAILIGCGESTIKKYFQEELSKGLIKANMNVAGALYKSAMGGNVTAQIFWCKTRLQWRETSSVEFSGELRLVPALNITVNDDKSTKD